MIILFYKLHIFVNFFFKFTYLGIDVSILQFLNITLLSVLITVKGVNFFGPKSEYIISGSDCGNIFIWDKNTGAIIQWMTGDKQGVVSFLSHNKNKINIQIFFFYNTKTFLSLIFPFLCYR